MGYTGYVYFDNLKCFSLYKSDYELFDDEEADKIMKDDLKKWTIRGIIGYSIFLGCSCLSFIVQVIVVICAFIQTPSTAKRELDTRVIPIPTLGFFGELFGRKLFQSL